MSDRRASESMFSPTWYRVAALKPVLRGHARIHRHDYRDEVWYVLEDRVTGRTHRFTPSANHLVGLMDGERTVQEIWEAAVRRLGDDAPSQSETIAFMSQLHAANVLKCDTPPDTLEIFRRHQQHQRVFWKQRLAHPLAIRIPLLDPDRFLRRWLPFVRPLLGWFGLALWLVVVALGAVLAAANWSALSENIVDRVLTPQNLVLLWLVYPAVKAVHELGHAFTARKWGAEIHEIGVMLLVLMPVPYVEASASSAFREKHRRMVVSAAGIMVELFLAALALFVWLNVEPGVVRALAWNVMLVGGVSTLFFNGNPLLRFDGYYVLADAIEIPNLATRSRRYLLYLIQKHLFNLPDLRSPVTARGERAWLLGYGIASFVYRMFIMAVIVLFIAGQFFVIGIVLAIWAVFTQLVLPLLKGTAFLFTNPLVRRRKLRAASTGITVLAALAVLILVPVPSWTRAEGVVWLPEQARVRSGVEGTVAQILTHDGDDVLAGEALIRCEDPFLATRVAWLESRARELDARFTAQQISDRSRADVIRKQRESVQAEIERAYEQVEALTIRSPVDGVFVMDRQQDWVGRFVRRGQLVAHVVDANSLSIRVAVSQDQIGIVREKTRNVEVRFADRGGQPVRTRILREVPAGGNDLPSLALATSGGGQFALDPREPSGNKAMTRIFQYDLEIPRNALTSFAGGRAYVRFDHGSESLLAQGYRITKQLLLSRFGV